MSFKNKVETSVDYSVVGWRRQLHQLLDSKLILGLIVLLNLEQPILLLLSKYSLLGFISNQMFFIYASS